MIRFARADMLERLRAEPFDVLVVGGGITGAGVALDAATRGLRVALVERDDFASGTSSKSSKLVHGGLRYLQQREFGLVYEALHERSRLMRNAPHLVTLLPFLIPILTTDGLINPKLARGFGSALWTYDMTGGWRVGKLHRRVDVDGALERVPTLDRSRLASAYVYYDAHTDDARLTLGVARTAAHFGAVVANHAEVRSFRYDGAGRVNGAVVSTVVDEFEVRAACVVNAAGVWADAVNSLEQGNRPPTLRPAKGIHLTVPRHRIGNETAAVLPVPKDGRSLFLVPDGAVSYLGTTDTDYTGGDLDDVHCTSDDIAYVLDAANATLTSELRESDVLGCWAGLRPLVRSAASAKTADLSRRHHVASSPSGIVTVTGGKLTTYRRMAADAVDEVVRGIGRGAARSRTARLALVADDRPATTDTDLDRPIVTGLPYRAADALHAVRHEMAMTLDDVLDRRTRCRIFARDDTAAAAADIAALIGPELGWDAGRQASEAQRYRDALDRERRLAGLPRTSLVK